MTEPSPAVTRTVAAAQLLFITPAALFMAALFFRNLLPANSPANGAQLVVMWYAGRHWTLWALLIGLPLAVLVIGATTLLRNWATDERLRQTATRTFIAARTHLATLLVAGTTLAAASVLGVVALHMLAN